MSNCLYGFQCKKVLKLAYQSQKASPEEFGKELILFIRENSVIELKNIFQKIELVEGKDLPNNKEIKEMKEKHIAYETSGMVMTWDDIYKTNHTFLHYYKKDFYILPDSSLYLTNILDYLYIINLDNNKFEVYKKNDGLGKESSFKGYQLLKAFDLENIPKSWDIDLENLD